jgi:hypothetical protein
VASDFTVVLFQRQHFGNEPGTFDDIEPNVTFVGPTKSFSFDCPSVDPSETAFLTFQSRDVDHQRNVFQVNGVDVFGGLPASPARSAWTGNILLVEPRHRLRATGNLLQIESRNARGEGGNDIDDFIIDNVVIVYKTPDVPWALPATTGDLAAFVKTELLPSITNVSGSGATADPADQHNEYVLPTASQLASWRGVFQSLLAGSWGTAHLQARMISSTYNVVQFLDTPSSRTYYVLMEGVPPRQCSGRAFAVHSHGAAPRRAPRPDRPLGHARAEPRRGRGRDPGDISLRRDSFSDASVLMPRSSVLGLAC